jgi:hypothetical protein
MIQEPKGLPAPTAVVFDTTMARPDAALALAALHVLTSRREARVGGVCVAGGGLDTAIFCDIVGRFYGGQARTPSSNAVLPIGFDTAANGRNPPMVEGAVNRKNAAGQPQYVRSIQRPADTAAPDALLRNAITFSAESVVVLSAPAIWLARSLELTGTAAQYKQRVRRVVIVEAGGVEQDAAALKNLIAMLPVPVVTCGREVGAALAVPRSDLVGAFSWAPANPVADALGASEGTTVPLDDVAALHYALNPSSGYFSVADGRLTVEPSKVADARAALVALATAKPTAPPARGR